MYSNVQEKLIETFQAQRVAYDSVQDLYKALEVEKVEV